MSQLICESGGFCEVARHGWGHGAERDLIEAGLSEPADATALWD